MHKRRKLVIASTLVIVLIALGIRVAYVNASVPQYPLEHHAMGEWVDLDGAFLEQADENTQGYSLKVDSAELMSYNDYIKEYGKDKSRTRDGFDAPSVVALTIDVRNAGNDKGAIDLFNCELVPSSKDVYYIYNSDLWVENEPKSEGSASLAIRPDTEYTTVIPYVRNGGSGGEATFKTPVFDTSFELILSNAPMRKVIDVDL